MVSWGHRNVVLKSLNYDSTRNFHNQINNIVMPDRTLQSPTKIAAV